MRSGIGIIAGVAAAAFILPCAPALAAPLTVGTTDTGNCYPFSCGPTDGLTEYQQSYSSAAFPSTISFNTITFGRNQVDSNPMDTGTYSVSFYLATSGFNALSSSNLALNEGTFLGSLGTFNISGSMPNFLSLTGSTINYNPLNGALLMDVTITNGSSFDSSYNDFFNADDTGTNMNRAWDTTSGSDGDSVGLVTTFSVGAPDVDGDRDIHATAVPEPFTLSLFGAGLAGAIAMRRRKKAKV